MISLSSLSERLRPSPASGCAGRFMNWNVDEGTSKPCTALSQGIGGFGPPTYRVVFRYAIAGGQRVAKCIFAESRSVVYDLFAQQLRELAKLGSSGPQ